ncbi:MAG TPA: hypothetical protein VGH28_22655 [Polyangiaceae bacterium]|jgi:hypothetical protein
MNKLLIAGWVVLTSACAVDATSRSSEATSTTQYVDIGDFGGVDQGAWYDLRDKLAGAFGGDALHQSLGLFCSVTSKLGDVHDCVWTFAGAEAVVDPKTAAIAVDSPEFQCHFGAKTTGPKLIALLSASADPLHEPLPGTNATIRDALDTCFQHPIDETPVTTPSDPAPTYVEASDYYTSATWSAKWTQAKAALTLGFEQVCGDTFCGGDYGDITSLAFVCSVTRSTGNVKECAWMFGGSYALPTKTGAEGVSQEKWRCDVPVKGTVSQLISVVNATDVPDDVLHRTLPGTTATAYDALLNCL